MQDRDRVFLDTNILVYLANEDFPFHSEILAKFKEISLSHEVWISTQVLREYAVVMTREGLVENPLSSEEVVADKTMVGLFPCCGRELGSNGYTPGVDCKIPDKGQESSRCKYSGYNENARYKEAIYNEPQRFQ
jgi:hypothetical protein